MAEQTTNTGQEQAYITANQKKENLKVSQMSPDEKLHYLRVKQKFQHLTFDEANEFNKLKNEGGEVEVNPNRDLKKTRPKENEEINDIFKEEDILSYMYQHWLLDGLNWIFKKTYSAVENGTDWLFMKAWNGRKAFKAGYREGKAEAENNSNSSKAAMGRFTNDVDRNYITFSSNQINKIDRDAQARMEQIERYVSGNPKDEEKNSLLYRMVSQMDNAQKTTFAHDMKESTENFARNVKSIQYMAATLTRTQLIQNEMSKKEVGRTPDQALFEAQTRRNAILIAQQVEKDPNSWDKLFKNIEKARKTVNESMDAGKYKSNKNKWLNTPDKNKALLEVNGMLGLDKEGKLIANTVVEDRSQYNLAEWAIRNNTTDLEQRRSLQELNNQQIANQGNVEEYINRRKLLYQRVSKMSNAPEHIRQAAQQHQANDNQQTTIPTGRGGR